VSVAGERLEDAKRPGPHEPAARPPELRAARPNPGAQLGTPSLIQSFNYAFEGVIWVMKHQRNMRIHVAAAVAVMVLAFVFDASKLELVALLLAIAFVLITEMVNTALEAATDIATSSFHPLAKIAKDIAAGAVLIAAINAIVVAAIVLTGHVSAPTDHALRHVRNAPVLPTAIGLLVVLLLVIAVKAATGTGTPLRGGLPSGHAALAFAGWMAITFVADGFEHRVLVSAVAFILAFLVAHTRIESGIHTSFEVALGALLGSGVTLLLFQAL
jgi:diacylglycerol kinase (ATP)